MNNGQQYHHSGVNSRPRMDFGGSPQLPSSSYTPQHHQQQHSYIPPNPFQGQSTAPNPFQGQSTAPNPFQGQSTPANPFQGQSNPPIRPAHTAFQGNNFTSTAFNPTPSGAFHSFSIPPPDFSQPPPPTIQQSRSVSFSSSTEVQPQGYTVPHQQHFESSVPPPSFDVYSPSILPTYRDSKTQIVMESSRPQSTSRETAAAEEAGKTQEELEKVWLTNFEQRILGRSKCHDENITTKMPLKLLEVQQMVNQSRTLTDKLRQLKDKMSLLENDGQDQAWWELVNQADSIKMELNGITQKFQDEVFVEKVCQLIHQRRKKRERKKKQKKLKVKEKKEQELLWKKEGEKIDIWREKLQLQEEEKRREVAIKTEADSILGEVQQKQNEGIKMQQLLESLITLRIVRLNKGAAHGYISTPQQDHLFNTTLKNITDVVKTQMEEYKLEEQTLRVMMEESTSYKRTSAGREPKDAVNKLETLMKKVLFGDRPPIDQDTFQDFTAADHSLETLLQRRNDWDQFVCADDSPLASSVPLNWVTPPAQPTAAWAQFQGQVKSL